MIPRIIHQIWEGKHSPLPDNLRKLGETWKRQNPDFVYILWNFERIDCFIRENYPRSICRNYYRLPYSIQRWDTARYLIICKQGGVYADFDTEAYRPLEPFLARLEKEGKKCFFQKDAIWSEQHIIAPSIFGAEAGFALFSRIIDRILNTGFSVQKYVSLERRISDTLQSTGPHAIQKDLDTYADKDSVCVVSEKEMILPYGMRRDIADIPFSERCDTFREKFSEEAIAGHYFFNDWTGKWSSKSKDLLTVIIPFLNEGEEVKKTVASIRETSTSNLRIILINDASTDGYDYLAAAREMNCEYMHHQTRRGVAASRDEGVEMCQTPYFLLLDAHMAFYEKGWDEKIILILSENPDSIVCSQTKVLRQSRVENVPDGKPGTFGAFLSLEKDGILKCRWNGSDPDPEASVVPVPVVLGGAYAAGKEYWQRLHGLKGLINYGMDEELISLKAWIQGGRCLLVKDWTVGHIYRGKFPYPVKNDYVLHNKIFIAELFFEGEAMETILSRLEKYYGATLFTQVYDGMDRGLIESEREYLASISRESLAHFLFKNASLR
jgi:glycosyltransferase involved in cell wall biosynthesis